MTCLVDSSWLHHHLPHLHCHIGCHLRLKMKWTTNPSQQQRWDLCLTAEAKTKVGHSPVPWEPWASHHCPKLNTKMQGSETLHPINPIWLLLLLCWLWETNTCYYTFYSTSFFIPTKPDTIPITTHPFSSSHILYSSSSLSSFNPLISIAPPSQPPHSHQTTTM